MIDTTVTALRNILTEEQATLYELTRDSYAKMEDIVKREISDRDINKLKIILSTDVAETGVTFSKVKYVIDTVKRKSVQYDSRTGIHREAVINVSKNSSEQRMGRTGRIMDGYYFPLLPYDEYKAIRDDTAPKIHSVVTESFDQHMLRILMEYKDDAMGNKDAGIFDTLMTRPSYETVCDSIDRLFTASAIDYNCEVTEMGKLIDRTFTNDIEYSHMILASVKEKCVTDTVRIVAIMITDPSAMFTDTAHSIDSYNFSATVMYTFGKLRLTEDAKQTIALLKCDYINLLAIYKEYLKHCTVNDNVIGVTTDAIDWCNSNGINQSFMDRVNKRFIKLMDKITEKEETNDKKKQKDTVRIPVIDSLQEDYTHYSNIKKVVLSALQRNVAVYVDNITQGSAQVSRYQLILPNAPDVTIFATIDTNGLPPVLEYGNRVVYGRCDRKETNGNIVYKIRYVTECP
jgi:HrpA-like RNA helicase